MGTEGEEGEERRTGIRDQRRESRVVGQRAEPRCFGGRVFGGRTTGVTGRGVRTSTDGRAQMVQEAQRLTGDKFRIERRDLMKMAVVGHEMGGLPVDGAE